MGPPLQQFEEALDKVESSEAANDEELDQKVAEALACDCVADLRDGPCGGPFVEAFTCFVKSSTPDKGMDCLGPFKMLQECMIQHPEEFAEFIESKAERDGRTGRVESQGQGQGVANSAVDADNEDSQEEKVAHM
eukprot:evm.model.scf_394.6 EVM.evm.TU.scf_394.6   scf_394:50852-51256(+)